MGKIPILYGCAFYYATWVYEKEAPYCSRVYLPSERSPEIQKLSNRCRGGQNTHGHVEKASACSYSVSERSPIDIAR